MELNKVSKVVKAMQIRPQNMIRDDPQYLFLCHIERIISDSNQLRVHILDEEDHDDDNIQKEKIKKVSRISISCDLS